MFHVYWKVQMAELEGEPLASLVVEGDWCRVIDGYLDSIYKHCLLTHNSIPRKVFLNVLVQIGKDMCKIFKTSRLFVITKFSTLFQRCKEGIGYTHSGIAMHWTVMQQ